MPKGPKGEKRPADVIGSAIMVAKIATGEIDDIAPDDGKDPAARALGKKGGVLGGKARARGMTDKARSDAARFAANARWNKSGTS